MKTTIVCCAALVAATFLPAQEKASATQPPNPKTKAHDAIAALAGDWQTTYKMSAVPGVSGLEKASESIGTEHAELICNGLWLKSTTDGTLQGKPFQGAWLLGYDPFAKTYRVICVSSQDEPAGEMTGALDEGTKTWTFAGKCPSGEFRGQFVFRDKDNSTETCWIKTPDGKENEFMQITRKRGKPMMAREASAGTGQSSSKELALLAEGVGNWTAKVTTSMPGQEKTEDTCTEQVVQICEGKWTWSNFKGSMMGAPFEGHALTGYDPTSKQFVSFWINSCCATPSRAEGMFDDAKKQFTFTGSCLDPQGRPATVKQIYSQPDQSARNLHMTCTGADGTHEMKIAYTRVKG